MAWNNFLGQEKAIAILKSYISSGKIPQTFIFSGIKGIGKFSLAKKFAQACNCLDYNGDICNSCPNCSQIEKEIHPDLFILKPGGKGGVITIDMIRDVEKFLNLSPQIAKKKFFLIDDAEKMNIEASNAFLKSLEEPPLDSIIILITTKPESLLPTIRSRCQEIKFSPLRKDIIQDVLKERYNISPDRAEYLSNISQGSIGQALRFKDKGVKDLYEEIEEFFISGVFEYERNLELCEKRNILKEKFEILLFFLRDILFLRLDVSEIAISRDKSRLLGKRLLLKDLIEKIEKIEYLYNTLDSNVNVGLVFKAGKQIWEEVKV